MKAFVYVFCGTSILQVGAIPAVLAERVSIIQEFDVDAIHVELNKE